MKNLVALSLILSFSMNAMDANHEVIQSGAIIAGGVLTAYAFGQGAEWASNTIAPRFTREYNNYWDTPSQRQNAIYNKWGFLATLWAGVPITMAARLGSNPLPAQDLIKPVIIAYVATAGIAALTGGYKYLRKPDAEKVGENMHIATRVTSYIAAPAGLIGYILYKRIKS